MSVACLFTVENESGNKNQIFGVNIEIPGVSGYKRDFSVWTLSKVLVLKHSIHSTLFFSFLLFFSPFSFDCRVYRWGRLGISMNCIIVSPWKFKKPPKTEQIKPPMPFVFGCVKFWGNSWIGVMGKLGICHGADPLLQLLSFGLSLPEVQPGIYFLL